MSTKQMRLRIRTLLAPSSYMHPLEHVNKANEITHSYLAGITHSYLAGITHSYLAGITHSYLADITLQ